MITSEEAIRIALDVVLGREPTDLSVEAAEFREKVTANVADMNARGIMVVFPFEL